MTKAELLLVYDAGGALELVRIEPEGAGDVARFGGARTEVVTGLSDDALVARFVALVAERRPSRNVVVVDEPGHPHLTLTAEPFPRLLATRRPAPGARVFGPFLPRTGARRLLGLAGVLCRLRTCTIDVDGSFAEPCGEHAAGRCLAPCVAALCPPDVYAEAVEDAALLATGAWEPLAERYDARMTNASDALDFESAARWRDAKETLAVLGPDLRIRAGLAGATDVVAVRREGELFGVHVTTTFRGRALGRRAFVARLTDDEPDDDWPLAQVLAQAYRTDVPSQIFVPVDGPRVRLVARGLGRREGRRVAVVTTPRDERPTSIRLAETDAEGRLAERFVALRSGRPFAALAELAAIAGLGAPPRRVEAFDVAHIAGEAMTAAASVCRDGTMRPDEYAVWYLDAPSELAAMEDAIAARAAGLLSAPDLLLVDGGKAHLAAAARGLERAGRPHLPLVGVVKPPGRHRDVAYLLVMKEGAAHRVELDERSEALRLVRHARDEAHATANAAHRELRGRLQLAREPRHLPVVVPTRPDDPDGAASDIIPIFPSAHDRPRPHRRTRTRRRVP